nr:HD domain-containing protein [Variibacter gotjawalensis]
MPWLLTSVPLAADGRNDPIDEHDDWARRDRGHPAFSPLVEQAANFAEYAHRFQKWGLTNRPYSDHLAEVASIVASAGLRDEAVAAAWLHDVIALCGVDASTLGELFGSDVALLATEVTDSPLDSGPRRFRKETDRERMAVASGEAQTIKAAEMISEIQAVVVHNPQGLADVYARECRDMIGVLFFADHRVLATAIDAVERAEQVLPLAS